RGSRPRAQRPRTGKPDRAAPCGRQTRQARGGTRRAAGGAGPVSFPRPLVRCQLHSGGSMRIGNRSLLALVVCLAFGIALGAALAQATPPAKDSAGISRQPGPEVDLGPDLPGYKLRVTTVTFAPGAVRALHDHKKNPEVTYTIQGKLTEFSKAGVMKEFGP